MPARLRPESVYSVQLGKFASLSEAGVVVTPKYSSPCLPLCFCLLRQFSFTDEVTLIYTQ